MCQTTTRYSWIAILIDLSAALFLAGVLLIFLKKMKQCKPGCYEHACMGTNYINYECDCGTSCQDKEVFIIDSQFKMAVAFIILGIVCPILGCVLVSYLRRRYYLNSALPASGVSANLSGVSQQMNYQQGQQPGLHIQQNNIFQYQEKQTEYGYGQFGQDLNQNSAY